MSPPLTSLSSHIMRIQYIFLLFWLISCKNEAVDKEPFRPLLYKITANSKTIYSFDYDENNRLITEDQYLTCDTPFKKITYHYSAGRLDSLSRDEKQLTNYLDTIFQPFVEPCSTNAIYKQFSEVPEYDGEGKLVRMINDEYVTKYSYNSPNKTEAVTTFRNVSVKSLKYDHNGNLVEEKDLAAMGHQPLGNFYGNIKPSHISQTFKYEYDTMRNPNYRKEIWPYQGPNNLVKMYGEDNTLMFEWNYTYNEQGFPLERTGSDGSKWIYHYR